VLDDPPRKLEFLSLADSVYNRFGIPMTVLLLAENVGFAPATNVGLAASHGEYICFLNSDVFPADDDWLAVLIERLRQHPKVGVIGPLLVFEDDTIQHCGMTFEPLVEFGGFQFPLHTNKGFIPGPARGLVTVSAITGACMVFARQTAMALRGFSEAYILGDFEDSDMCLRLHQSGQLCAVDPSVRLYHLERQSQLTSRAPWRMNLTLYNAWQHEALWGTTIKVASQNRARVMEAAE
jgi:GT2 family glycosyltransferase